MQHRVSDQQRRAAIRRVPCQLPPTSRIRAAGLVLMLASTLVGVVYAGPHLATALGEPGFTADRPVFSVAALQRQVVRDPGDWLGLTVRVRGRAATYKTWSPPDSIVTRVELRDADTPFSSSGLPLVWDGGDPLLTSLRQLPLLGQLVPPPQVIRWGARATYRVRLRVVPATSCMVLPCIEADLVDATPGSFP
jgi:hypothetical protein